MFKVRVLMSTGEGQSTHCRAAPQHADSFRIRRSPAGVVQHLLPRHLVVRRRDLGDLEKTPATTLLAPSVSALAPADSQNNTATRAGMQTDCQDAQQPVRTACRARRGRRAAPSIVQEAGGERGRERSRSGGVALKSTGSRRRAPRSASTARATSRQCASQQPQPAAAP